MLNSKQKRLTNISRLGTLCYCDAFCEQHNDDDCCPDFLFACADGPAPVYEATCPHKGGTIKAGKTVWDNCNSW